MPLFSVIVPHTDDTHLFDNTLASVLRSKDSETEVVVVHNGAYKDPYGLDAEVRFASTGREAGLAGMVNRGIRHADGEFVAIIRPGIELPDNWQAEIAENFCNRSIGSVSPLIVDASDRRKLVAAGVNFGRGLNRRIDGQGKRNASRVLKHLRPAGPTSWAAFYRRDVLAEIGDLDEQLEEGYLDLDLALAAQSLGYLSKMASHCVLAIERPFLITREASLPHGESAHRAFTRHRPEASTGDRMLSIIADGITGVFRTSMFTHAWQRLAARHSLDIDRLFARRIARVIDDRKLERKTATSGSPVAGRIEPERSVRSHRRAA
ncbi:MAG: glycosyltransferase [Planctomycetota bacterium]